MATNGNTHRFVVFEDKSEQWRWKLVHKNGQTVAESGESYVSKSYCSQAVNNIIAAIKEKRYEIEIKE